ncbi:MAG: dicarboxylate/amino acid:cation symporter [Acidobacteriota bacterium]
MRWWFRQPLYIQIFICILIGILLGLVLGDKASWIKPLGDIFIRLLMMLIVPLTFFTLISGMTKLEDLRSFRSLGGMIILYYLASSLVAGILGIFVALVMQPGKKAAGLLAAGGKIEPASFNFIDNLVSWVPKNPVESLASGNMLQIIVFSIIAGIGLLAVKNKAKNLTKVIHDASDLMITITGFVMKTAPYGILALVANMVASMKTEVLHEVLRFILADYIALLILLILFYPLILIWLTKLNPIRFYRNISPAMLVAASTTSSSATLPVSMSTASDNLGAPEKIWGFTLPLGATINMNGMAAAIGVIAVFAANIYGLSITPVLMLQFMFLGLVLSVGTAGIKGAGIVMSTILLKTLNLPLELIPILASVWPILDIGHTTCNVTGDLVGTTIVGEKLKAIDKKIFNRKNAIIRKKQKFENE